jgi:hypothetical protein
MSGQPASLLEYIKRRTAGVIAKLVAAMKKIEAEIEANHGVYPYNAGRLSRAETCRRAGIRSSVLEGRAHKKTTLVMLRQWLTRINGRIAVGKKAVRKAVTDRVEGWKERAVAAERFSNLYHLQMVTLDGRLQEVQREASELREENRRLQEELSSGRVVPLRPRS